MGHTRLQGFPATKVPWAEPRSTTQTAPSLALKHTMAWNLLMDACSSCTSAVACLSRHDAESGVVKLDPSQPMSRELHVPAEDCARLDQRQRLDDGPVLSALQNGALDRGADPGWRRPLTSGSSSSSSSGSNCRLVVRVFAGRLCCSLSIA